jgi:hypothetical protein
LDASRFQSHAEADTVKPANAKAARTTSFFMVEPSNRDYRFTTGPRNPELTVAALS